jgi:TIR domain/Bacterial Ig domain
VKIFVSYSRRDAGDFAELIQRHFSSFKYDVFTDVNSISIGDIWSNTIETNISNCDVFIIIVTYGALQSPHVKNEVLQAQTEKKRIIPCFHRSVRANDIKWGLNKVQGVEFNDKYELVRDLYPKITRIQKNSSKGPVSISSERKEDVFMDRDISISKEATSSNKEYAQQHKEPLTALDSKKARRINLKIVIPVIAVVIGATLAFTVFGIGVLQPTPNNNVEPKTPLTSPPATVVNNPPVPIDNDSITTSMNQPVNIQLPASDKDDDDLTASIESIPSHGNLTDINQVTGQLTYTPNPGFTGVDNFTFNVNDGKVNSSKTGIVKVTVN